MQTEQIKFREEYPSEVTLTMSTREAALLARHCGQLTGVTGNDATSALYDTLNQMVFLPYWEDGVNSVQV